MSKSILTILACFAIICAKAQSGRTIAEIPNPQLADSTCLLSNPDTIINDSLARCIDSVLIDIRRCTSAEVAAVIVNDFDGDDIDEFATALFNAWGIGKSNDNGVLLFVAKERNRMTIRTGYGAEGILPDIICGRIMREYITPHFKRDDYGAGIQAGVEEIQRLFSNPETAEELATKKHKEQDGDGWMYTIGFILAIALFIWLIIKLSNKGKGNCGKGNNNNTPTPPLPRLKSIRSERGGGAGNGTFSGGSFGGGRTGGGGASGGW